MPTNRHSSSVARFFFKVSKAKQDAEAALGKDMGGGSPAMGKDMNFAQPMGKDMNFAKAPYADPSAMAMGKLKSSPMGRAAANKKLPAAAQEAMQAEAMPAEAMPAEAPAASGGIREALQQVGGGISQLGAEAMQGTRRAASRVRDEALQAYLGQGVRGESGGAPQVLQNFRSDSLA